MDGEEDASNPMIEANGTGGEAPLSPTTTRKNRPIISAEPLDIEAYAGLYTCRTKIKRLIFIASHCDNPTMQLEALRMAYDEIKKGENTQLFREVVQKIEGRLGPNYEMDAAWCSTIERKAEQRKEKLESELNSYRFLEVGPELGNSYSEVIAPQDVATYGGLCALASFDRTELKNKVIDNINFRDFLELVPEVRELINDFYSSHYASCLEYLGNLKPNLMFDIHLYDHVETL